MHNSNAGQVIKTWGTAMNESVLRVLKKQFLRSE